MANAVKCPSCGSYYNGAVYGNCPYCGVAKTPITQTSKMHPPTTDTKVSDGEDAKEKKGIGIKLPFFDKVLKSERSGKSDKKSTADINVITANSPTESRTKVAEVEENSGINLMMTGEATELISEEEAGIGINDRIENNDHIGRKEYAERSNPVEKKQESSSLSSAISRSGKTVGKYISNSTGETISPVVGWIIGVKGADYGKPYKLKSGRNKIGRSVEMDVALEEESVSRSSVAVIAFDSKQREFSLMPGDSDSLCFLNGHAVYERCMLGYGDELEFGDSELNKYVFVPLCGESFNWDKYPQKENN